VGGEGPRLTLQRHLAGAMTRLAQGEQNVSVPGLQRRDELGELARAFNGVTGDRQRQQRKQRNKADYRIQLAVGGEGPRLTWRSPVTPASISTAISVPA
jgi:hypothetical protein